MDKKTVLVVLAIALVLAGGGAVAGWYFTRPVPIIETAKPAETQVDGSIVLERAATTPKAKPRQKIPKGSKVERVSAVTVQPTALGQVGKPCPPVTVDMTLVRQKDGGRRVIASSPDGQVVSGLDIPVETVPAPEARPWAVGLSLDPARQTAGGWVERDVGRLRVGAEINQTRPVMGGATSAEVRLRVGWVF